jgi:hypothetical protein
MNTCGSVEFKPHSLISALTNMNVHLHAPADFYSRNCFLSGHWRDDEFKNLNRAENISMLFCTKCTKRTLNAESVHCVFHLTHSLAVFDFISNRKLY